MATITKLTKIAYSEGLTHKAVREAINSNSTKADTNFANLNTAVVQAKSAADDAMEMATGAAETAGTAKSKAEAAASAASAADSKAQTAQTAASAAVAAANEAKSTAQTATEKANQASTTAKLAGDTATKAQNTANTAKQTADAASTTATAAKSTANNANATANAAKSKAADAEETAQDALALAQMTNGQAVLAQFDTINTGTKTMDSNVNYDVATLPTSGVKIEFYQSVNIGGKVRQKGVFVAKTASRYYVNWKAEPIQGIADSRLFNDGRQTTADTNPHQYLIAGSFTQTNGIQAGTVFICRATGRIVIKDTTGSDGWKYLDSTHWPE